MEGGPGVFLWTRALLWILIGPVGFLLALQAGYLNSFDQELGTLCTILAVYNFAAAFALAGATDEQLPSRWPAVILLAIIGLGYLSWLPLNLAMPIGEAHWLALSAWFPGIILLTCCFASRWPSSCCRWPKSARNWSNASKP